MLEPSIPVPVSAECRAAAEAVALLCESLGHVVEPAAPTLDAARLWTDYGKVVSVGVAYVLLVIRRGLQWRWLRREADLR